MANKLRLKDIISKKEIIGENAQTKNQAQHLKKHQQLFEQLSNTLTTRPLTFAKFSFRKVEVENDEQLRPIVKGIYEHNKQGSMITTELWSKKQQRQYLKQTNLYPSKRILKRFAHWEWDYNSNKERFREMAEKLKQEIYTQESEIKTKIQLDSTKGEQMLRQRIIREWTRDRKQIDVQERVQIYRDGQQLPKVGKHFKANSSHQIQLKNIVKNEKMDKILHSLDKLQIQSQKDIIYFNHITRREHHSMPRY